MTMKEYSKKLEEETREADRALLNQYKKELADLEAGDGLAKYMYKPEIERAKTELKAAIAGLGYLEEN